VRRTCDSDDADLVQSRLLRVTLHSASLITGQKQLAMDIYTDAPPATLTKQGRDLCHSGAGRRIGDIATQPPR